MIAGTCIVSGPLLLGPAFLFDKGAPAATTMTACWCVVLMILAGVVEIFLGVKARRRHRTRFESAAGVAVHVNRCGRLGRWQW